MVREVTIKINLYAQKRIPSIAIKNSSDTVCTYPTVAWVQSSILVFVLSIYFLSIFHVLNIPIIKIIKR